MRHILALLVMAIALPACSNEYHAQCHVPNENLLWFYKSDSGNPLDHDYCVMCDTTVSPDELEAWLVQMGANGPSGAGAVLTPCLYVYPTEEQPTDGPAECKAMICGGDPNYNDMVGVDHAIHASLLPILNGEDAPRQDLPPENALPPRLSTRDTTP